MNNQTKKECEMNSKQATVETKDRRTLFFTLWIFVTLNYLYCDVLGLFDPETLNSLLTGHAGTIQITPSFLLMSGILMEIPMGMVLLSRILNYKANRWANVIAGSIMTLVQIASLFFGTAPTYYYIFFSVIEVATTAFIVWYAVTWTNPER